MMKSFLSDLLKTRESKLADALLFGNYKKALILARKIRSVKSYSYFRDEKVLDLAAKKGYIEVCELLIDKGAGVNLQDWEGWTVLHKTCQKCHPEVVKLLLRNGTQIDLQTNNGETALMIASSHGHSAIVKILLDSGAQVDLQSKKGETALDYAKRLRHSEVVDLLNPASNIRNKKSSKEGGTTVSAKDINRIRKFLRESACEWWASNRGIGDIAFCDFYCDEIDGRRIDRDNGYLLGRRLLCKPCCDKILNKMAGKSIKELDAAWEADLFNIMITSRKI